MYVLPAACTFQDNVSLNTQPAPPMQLTDGQTSTHYEDVDASVDQGTADCGKGMDNQIVEDNSMPL